MGSLHRDFTSVSALQLDDLLFEPADFTFEGLEVAASVFVDGDFVELDEFDSTSERQRRQRLLTADEIWANVGNEMGLRVTA